MKKLMKQVSTNLTRELLVYRIDQWWCKKHGNKSDRKIEIGHTFYTTIGQSYIPTTLSLENVFINLLDIGLIREMVLSIKRN